MLPIKKLHTQHVKKNIYANVEDFEDDEDMSYRESSNEGNSPRKQRKRRTLSETSKRDFVCGCGKSYVSYPAIYLHVQRKHNGDWPKNTLIPEKSDSQDQVKRGRPKKEKHNMLDVNNDLQSEVKYKAEDNFWLFIGTKGNTGNPKLENKFITHLETQPYNPLTIFQYNDLFVDTEIHQDISQILKAISSSTGAKNANQAALEGKSMYETHLSHFILWISNPLKEEIFVELSIIVSLLRIYLLCSIYTENQKSAITLKEDVLEINIEPFPKKTFNLSKPESAKLEALMKHPACPLFGSKWIEIRKTFEGNILMPVMSEAKKVEEIETLFYNKLQSFANPESEDVEYVADALLQMKETEVKEEIKQNKKFYFLNWNTKEDLKELLQKLCDWLHCFDEKELQIQDIGLV